MLLPTHTGGCGVPSALALHVAETVATMAAQMGVQETSETSQTFLFNIHEDTNG